MRTFKYNISGEIRYLCAMNTTDALRKIFFGELKRLGKVDMSKVDIIEVKSPRSQKSEVKNQIINIDKNLQLTA